MILQDRVFELAPTAVETGFSVGEYLKSRTENPDFVMVEIGHDNFPVAFQQGGFTKKRAYIGVEAWLRDLCGKRDYVESLRQNRGKQNIFFIDHNTEGLIYRDRKTGESGYFGDYSAETCLPPEVANEVLLNNVFGDPHVAFSKGTEALIKETARLTKLGGYVIIRETITPHFLQLSVDQIENSGLEIAKIVTQDNEHDWQSLQELYVADPHALSRYKNQYIFLSKPEQ